MCGCPGIMSHSMSGRNAPRSKNGKASNIVYSDSVVNLSVGCQTCRQRKVKCDESRPICHHCSRLNIGCEWGYPSKRGRRNLQIRTAHSATGNRQWYLSSVWRHYGESPLLWTGKELSKQTTLEYDSSWPSWLSKCDISVSQFSSTPSFALADRITSQCNLNAMTLNISEITCANSLTLTVSDQNYFRYFPSSSVVFYYMKPWEWSSFGFLYQGPAATNKLIMRMILAIAASDMHRRGLVPNAAGQGASKNPGRYHYEVAVQEFRQYLEEHGAAGEMQEEFAADSECEIIFCIMFLMIMYEWYYGHSVKHLQLHLQGVRCLLKAHPKMFTNKGMTDAILSTGSIPQKGLSFMPAQFLLWILYVFLLLFLEGVSETNFQLAPV